MQIYYISGDQKFKMGRYNPVISVLDIYPKKNTNSKRYMHPFVYFSIIYNSQVMEAT